MNRIAQRVASRHLLAKKFTKTAGEVRFIKDRSGDKNEWGWNAAPGPSEREILDSFEFKRGKLKPLAKTLRAALAALGHAQSAQGSFIKIKSATISPDGALGGKGYIQKIPEMRRQLGNAVEALSAFTDTVYDELHAPHWNRGVAVEDPRERKQVKEIMEDVEEIREDPEDWAEEEEAGMSSDQGKQASRLKVSSHQDLSGILVRRVASRFLRRGTA